MYIKNAFIEMDNNNDYPFKLLDNTEEHFGVLTLELDKVEITKQPVFILFTIDATASMTDYASKNRTKIQYVIQTLNSIMNYLSLHDINVTIQINTFNIKSETIIEPIIITKKNVNDIIEKIETIKADFATNIEDALKYANECITEYKSRNNEYECVHIFMTDGEPTCGSLNTNELVKCVSGEYMSINIGFGDDHNATLLYKLSNLKNGEYHFIDKIEKASVVYGESLHKVLYPCLKNITISIENGLIYDWKTNTWKPSIYENVLIGEIKKYYHVKTTDVLNINANLNASIETVTNNIINKQIIEEEISRLPDLLNSNNEIVDDNTIIKFAFRQRILEVLYDGHKSEAYNDICKIKHDIKHLFGILVTYMKQHELIYDSMLNQLKNDLYVTYWNIGSYTSIYIGGRHISQGSQSAYTPSNHNSPSAIDINSVDDIIPRPLLRRTSHDYVGIDTDLFILAGMNDEIPSVEYTSSDDDTTIGITDNEYSCYTSPGTRNTVNSIRLYDN
jgi:hypothetical protein